MTHCLAHGLISILNGKPSGSLSEEGFKQIGLKMPDRIDDACRLSICGLFVGSGENYHKTCISNVNYDSNYPLVDCPDCIKVMKEHGL